jgi:hypothetical protein
VKRYRVVEWDDALIYGVPLLALLLGSSLHWIVLLPAAAWAFIASRYFYPRWKTWRSIDGYLPGGWALIGGDVPVSMAVHVTEALRWWVSREPDPLASPLIRVGAGGIIAVERAEYITTPPRAGFAAVLAPSTERARGLTGGNNIRIAWQPSTNGAGFCDVLKHEIGHVVLNAMEFQGDHHAEMKRLAYPWA